MAESENRIILKYEGLFWCNPDEGMGGAVINPKECSWGHSLECNGVVITFNELSKVMMDAVHEYVKDKIRSNSTNIEPTKNNEGYSFENMN